MRRMVFPSLRDCMCLWSDPFESTLTQHKRPCFLEKDEKLYFIAHGLFYHIPVFIVPALACRTISTNSIQVTIDSIQFYIIA